MLCNALARGLILFWIPKPIVKFDEKKNIDTATSDNKRTATKGPEKTNLVQSLPMDPNRYSDIKAAIEVQSSHYVISYLCFHKLCGVDCGEFVVQKL